MESMSHLPYVLVCQFTVSFPTSELCYICFSYNYIFFMTLGWRSFVVRCITCGSNVWNNVRKLRFVFVRHCDVFLLRYNYVFYFFDVVTFFDDVRNFGTFELRMEKTLQLRFVFVRHCNVFFIMSQLRCLFVRCNYIFGWR